MRPRFFFIALVYLLVLIGIFIVYVTSGTVRGDLPASLGNLPVGVAWFGAIGAVLSSLWGIFNNNKNWDSSYDYWYYIRPLFGAVTGSIGALLYWVSLELGNSNHVSPDRPTFYVVAFILGFADAAFIQLLKSITNVIIKPGTPSSTAQGDGAANAPTAGEAPSPNTGS